MTEARSGLPVFADKSELKSFLDGKVRLYNTLDFIENDPVKIPHKFNRLQDIEIMAFWVSMLAWGQRITIINKATELIELMEGEPYEFILNHKELDRERFLNFKHRTFNATDTIYFLEFFQWYYNEHESLENAFVRFTGSKSQKVKAAITGFHEFFFSLPNTPQRTRKHIATPVRKSTCKRMNMFLRWMVRRDENGVDFGLWQNISPSELMMPLDVHVDRIARKLGLIDRKQRDWLTVEELTARMRELDPEDPVKYDFALFGLGVDGKSIPSNIN